MRRKFILLAIFGICLHNEAQANSDKAVQPFAKSCRTISVGTPILISAKNLNKSTNACGNVIPPEKTKTHPLILIGLGNHCGVTDILYIATTEALDRLRSDSMKFFIYPKTLTLCFPLPIDLASLEARLIPLHSNSYTINLIKVDEI